MRADIGVITNPNSKKNRKHTRRLQQLERAAGPRAIVRQTANVAELPGVVEELLAAGCRYWVSDGGDGALHWLLTEGHRAIRRRVEAGEPVEWPALVPTNGGTIDFVAKKAGIRGHAEDILVRLGALLDAGKPPDDVVLGTVWATGEPAGDARPLDRLGFAVAIGGVAQRFFAKYYEDAVPGPKTIVKVLAAGFGGHFANTVGGPVERLVPGWVREYAADLFRPLRGTVEVDGQTLPYHEFTTVQAGSIDINLGNVVRTFRHAAGGGALHLQALHMTPAEAFLNVPTIVMGTRVRAGNTYDGPARSVRVTAFDGESIDPVVDGERFFGQRVLDLRLGPPVRIPRV